jgi:hypothetical protein
MTAAEKAALVSQEDVEKHLTEKEVKWLVDCIPIHCITCILGEQGMRQITDPAEHRRAISSIVRSKAGSNGAALGKARRVLHCPLQYQKGTNVFSASSLLINSFLASIGDQDDSEITQRIILCDAAEGNYKTLQQIPHYRSFCTLKLLLLSRGWGNGKWPSIPFKDGHQA